MDILEQGGKPLTIEYSGKHLVLVHFSPKELEAMVAYGRDHKINVAKLCRDCTLDLLHALGYLETGSEEQTAQGGAAKKKGLT